MSVDLKYNDDHMSIASDGDGVVLTNKKEKEPYRHVRLTHEQFRKAALMMEASGSISLKRELR